VAIVACQPVRTEEYAHAVVRVLVQVDAGLDEVRAQATFRQLQPSPGPGDGVVVADRALLDDTENLAPGFGAIRHEGTALLLRRDRKGLVVFADIMLVQPTVGGLDIVGADEPELLGQAILQGAEGALRAAPGLGRVGGDVLDAELRQGAAGRDAAEGPLHRAALRLLSYASDARANLLANRPALAAQEFLQTLIENPNDAYAYWGLSEASRMRGDTRGATAAGMTAMSL
jgi:hypothetical protein